MPQEAAQPLRPESPVVRLFRGISCASLILRARMLRSRGHPSGGGVVAALGPDAWVSQTYIAKLESGDRNNPTLDLLKKIAKVLGVPVTKLLR